MESEGVRYLRTNCWRWDIHHDFGSFVISNLSKMLKFAAAHCEMTNKTKHQLVSKTFVNNINEGKEMR